MKQSKYSELSEHGKLKHLDSFILDHWSYSAVGCFSRNEKAFEKDYIYRQKGKMSPTTIAGQAYHSSLEQYFLSVQDGESIDIAGLQSIAFDYIGKINPDRWKIQKTSPTINQCIQKAQKTVSQLLNNFISEIDVYMSDIKKIESVEQYIYQWVVINGVDIPLPVKARIDLVALTNDNKLVIIDHKSKSMYTDEKEIALTTGKQAICYVAAFEAETETSVDEVWFIENKYSKNRDNSAQLCKHTVILDNDTRKIYESMLYEPLRRMIEAVQNPDYIYVVNDTDNYVDKAEMFEFWMQTMIAEADDSIFSNIPDSKKEQILKRQKKIKDSSLKTIQPSIIKQFKDKAASFINYDLSNKNMTQAEKIEHVLNTFGKNVKVEYEFDGFSSDTFLLSVASGLTVKSVFTHKLDIAAALGVSNIRIQDNLFQYKNKAYICVEVAKKNNRSLAFDPKFIDGSKLPIGIDNFNNCVYWDVDNPSTPHMLICGGTGSGKSVSIISTIGYAQKYGFDEIVLFDPKFEFCGIYGQENSISVYSDISEIETMMSLLVDDMNERAKRGSAKKTLIVFDEFADAVANSRKGAKLKKYEMQVVGTYKDGRAKMKKVHVGDDNSLEDNLRILLQKGRSLGYRIISATQRASTKVITGDAKVNFPVRLCFRVQSETDSRVVLDETGAETLLGRGDGLYKSPEYDSIIRIQGFFKS